MKVLVIDDERQALKQIEKALASGKALTGHPLEVTTESDHTKAIDLAEKERFEIIITDMYMGPEQDEGLAILRRLTGKSPITIVLTAYPSIPNCVQSMRAGAWDYLEKVPEGGSDAYENLCQSIREACEYRLEHPEAARSAADTRWVSEHIEQLMRDFPGEVVAVLDQEVVDHDEHFDKLSERVAEQFTYAKPAMISIPDTRVDTVG